jgi:hypothetical protein
MYAPYYLRNSSGSLAIFGLKFLIEIKDCAQGLRVFIVGTIPRSNLIPWSVTFEPGQGERRTGDLLCFVRIILSK